MCMSTSMVTASDPTCVKIRERQHTHKKLKPKRALCLHSLLRGLCFIACWQRRLQNLLANT